MELLSTPTAMHEIRLSTSTTAHKNPHLAQTKHGTEEEIRSRASHVESTLIEEEI
jgi:hypothetical protein